MKFLKTAAVALAILAPAVLKGAGDFTISARLDSAMLLMGNTTPLHLEVEQPRDLRVSLPMLRESAGRGYISLLNDTVEVSEDFRADTVESAPGRIRVNYRFLVQAFDSGAYRLPPFLAVCGKDTARSQQLSLTVIPVKVGADEKIDDFSTIIGPWDPTLSDEDVDDGNPSWLRWWWLIPLAIAVAILTWWAVRRLRTGGSLLPRKPETPPYDEAIESMHRLKAEKLWENGREKDYYTRLTDILRRYLVRQYDIQAMEMTSREIMKALKENDRLRPGRPQMRQILNLADFVKFAKVRPLPDDNVKAFGNAMEFLELARPLPGPENPDEADKLTDSASRPQEKGGKDV